MCISRRRECYLIYVHGIKRATEGRGERTVTADRCECAKHELQPDERALDLKILEQLYPASRCTIIDRTVSEHNDGVVTGAMGEFMERK
jgi:hypothetical protein